MTLPKQFDSKVVGVTFTPDYPASIFELEVKFWERSSEGLTALLVRNPDNAYDANAIEVHAPATGKMIGHLPAPLAARLAPEMDAGEKFLAEFVDVVVNDAHPERPGISVSIRRAQ